MSSSKPLLVNSALPKFAHAFPKKASVFVLVFLVMSVACHAQDAKDTRREAARMLNIISGDNRIENNILHFSITRIDQKGIVSFLLKSDKPQAFKVNLFSSDGTEVTSWECSSESKVCFHNVNLVKLTSSSYTWSISDAVGKRLMLLPFNLSDVNPR